MYDDYYQNDNKMNHNKFDLQKVLNIFIIIIISVMFIIVFLWIKSVMFDNKDQGNITGNEKYEKYEKLLEEAAEKYYNNNILSSSEKYISAKTLNVEIPTNCSIASGVITSGNLNKAYLLCSDYESTLIEKKDNSITLVGKNVYIIAKGNTFSDPGYISNGPVIVSGVVNDTEGVYNIYYINQKNNEMQNRKVIVIDDNDLKYLFPTIKLNGDNNIYMVKGSSYKDLGAVANDPQDGDISYKINKIGSVNTNEVGEYKITYSVSNRSGFSVSASRTVTVLNNISELEILEEINPTEITNQKVTINMKVLGENYSHSYLPTGEKVSDSVFSYDVSENGIYHFWAYDKYGRSIEKKVKIENIDRKAPVITCDANIYGNRVDVIVTSISKPISKYKFIVNDSESDYTSQTSYVKNITDFKKAVVNVVDYAGNSASIKCTSVKKDPTIGNNNIRYYDYNGVEYVIANTKNDLTEFVKQTRGKISQSVFSNPNDPNYRCTGQCLGFSQYHAGYLQIGNIYNMNALAACNYNTIKHMVHDFYPTKAGALEKVYNEIFNGNVCVLQVAGGNRTSRHFVLVVGYNRQKYNASELQEEDLLTIDSWTGNFTTLSSTDYSRRGMFSRGAEGYRVDYFG